MGMLQALRWAYPNTTHAFMLDKKRGPFVHSVQTMQGSSN
jgi:hypothetical protein